MCPNSGINVRPIFLIEVFLSGPFTKQTWFDKKKNRKKQKNKTALLTWYNNHRVTVFVYCNHTEITNAGIFVTSDLLWLQWICCWSTVHACYLSKTEAYVKSRWKTVHGQVQVFGLAKLICIHTVIHMICLWTELQEVPLHSFSNRFRKGCVTVDLCKLFYTHWSNLSTLIHKE